MTYDWSSELPDYIGEPARPPHLFGRERALDRLQGQSKEQETLAPQRPLDQPPPKVASKSHRLAALACIAGGRRRSDGRRRYGAVILVTIGLSLVAVAAAAWHRGLHQYLTASAASGLENSRKPTEAEPKVESTEPAAPSQPQTPRAIETPSSCFTEASEARVGAGSCGFDLAATGALSFRGIRIAERITADNRSARRLVLYPFSRSGRFVFIRACDSAIGGHCNKLMLVDTEQRKVLEVGLGGEGIVWVIWSPGETMALLGRREKLSDKIAVVRTIDGKTIRTSAIRVPKNRYALLRPGSVKWRDDNLFTFEEKLCRPTKGHHRNRSCEEGHEGKYRRRVVKLNRQRT